MDKDSRYTLIHDAFDWTNTRRVEHRPNARQLDEIEKRALSPFFDTSVLDIVRVLEMDDLALIDDSLFAHYFTGSARPIELDKIFGLTLIDTICLARNRLQSNAHRLAVLFQEVVHVCQFKRLGVEGFLMAYLDGWESNGRSHGQIPLERQAEALRVRFEGDMSNGFSVEKELSNE